MPLICMDEASKQLLTNEQPCIPLQPGRGVREDYHYERRGTQAIFMFVDPIRGWRRVEACDSRTRVDWAEQVRRSLEEDYPDAKRVKWVCDNSNTHAKASLYEAFPAEHARRLAGRLSLVHTPLAEYRGDGTVCALATMPRCSPRHRSKATIRTQAWEDDRNQNHCTVRWRFTTADARIRLRRLYP